MFRLNVSCNDKRRSLHVFLISCIVFAACPLGCFCHSISVVVKHRQSFAVKETWEPDHIQLPKDVEEELKFEPNMKENQPSVTLNNKIDNDVTDKQNSENTRDYHGTEDNDLDNPTEDVTDDYDDVTSYKQATGKLYDGSKDDDFDDDFDDDNDDERGKDYTLDNVIDDDDLDNDDVDIDYDDDDDTHNTDTVEPSKGTGQDRMSNDEISAKETKLQNLDLLDVDKEDRIVEHVYKVTKRKKRAVKEQWRNSLHGIDESRSKDELLTSDVWEDVTDEELDNIQKQQYIRLAKYIGWTLLSVVFFVLVGICFLRDPMACIFSFGTGCPCCLFICPCIRGFVKKHLDFKKMVRDAMNKYTPGVIVHDDGSIQHYDPTAEEVDYLKELLDEMAGQAVV